MILGEPIVAMKIGAAEINLTASLRLRGRIGPTSTDEIIAGRLPPEALTELLSSPDELTPLEDGGSFRACVLAPQKIIMVGLNYRRHAEEAKSPIPDTPMLFGKFNNALAAHGDVIRLPTKYAAAFDYEAELIIVIGRLAADVPEAEALDYVFGYSVGNDLSARDLQRRTSQMLLGKSLDGFAPIGPWLTGSGLVDRPDDLKIICSVNGQIRQSSSTSDMIFSCRQIVSYISRYMTLLPGDIIFTGTPEGVAAGYPEGEWPWLKPGDNVSVSIEQLGTLTNAFAASA
jgi:2-keto-4-pentenoate hydratase/2-oxohepta-3-ene-1,7-dioic acid hydratase in catechol pathway